MRERLGYDQEVGRISLLFEGKCVYKITRGVSGGLIIQHLPTHP